MVDVNQELTGEEKIEAISRVAMPDKQRLKRWLRDSGREYLVFQALDLVDSLSWPEGILRLMQMIEAYREHRSLIETGALERQQDDQGNEVDVPVTKTEQLTKDEAAQAIRQLAGVIRDEDPEWRLSWLDDR